MLTEVHSEQQAVVGADPVVDNEHVDSHYEAVGKVYEGAFFYRAGPFNDWLAENVASAMNLSAGMTLADVGGGTGAFVQLLSDQNQLGECVIVDPSEAMLEKARQRRMRTELLGADEFAAQSGALFDRILLKEVVHHLEDRHTIYSGLHRRMRPGGRLVIVTRPKYEIDYPFFAAAKEQWALHQPEPDEGKAELEAAGFQPVHTLVLTYPCSIATKEWLGFVRVRGWSTFNIFSDSELEEGCAEIIRKYGDTETLTFEERIVLVIADASEREA